jgi:ADP-ribose pyrophosphatase
MSATLIHKGSLISIYKESVALRNGGHTEFDIVKHPGGAVIAAINLDDKICLLKQWRHALQQDIWELPAGCLEPGEPPQITAKRELEEEAGVVANHWQALGQIAPSPGFSNEILHLFLATQLQPGTIKLDDAERLEAHWFTKPEVREMARNGDIIDAKTLALLYQLLLLD